MISLTFCDVLKCLATARPCHKNNNYITPKCIIAEIDVHNINTFKNKLDTLWANENVKFNWRSNLASSVNYS